MVRYNRFLGSELKHQIETGKATTHRDRVAVLTSFSNWISTERAMMFKNRTVLRWRNFRR